MLEQLYEQILDDPDDVERRLVYADALQQLGDPRGDFIAVMARSPELRLTRSALANPAWHGIVELTALWAAHQRKWLDPIRPYLGVLGEALWCGALDQMRVEAGRLGKGAAQVFSVMPIRTLHLTGRRVQLGTLAELRGPRCVRKLDLSDVLLQRRRPPDDLAALRAAAFSGLRELDLAFNQLEDHGLGLLLDALRERPLRPLRRLHLPSNELTSDGARLLACSPALATVELLDLSVNLIDDAGALALAESEHLANLEELMLAGNPIGADAIAALRASPRLPKLREIVL